MALTVTLVRADPTPLGKEAVFEVQFDSSYPTGGETLDLSVATLGIGPGFTTVVSVSIEEGPYTSAGAKTLPATCSSIQYDFAASRAVATGLLLAYAEDGTSGVEAQVANTTNLSAVYCRIKVVGT